jgi:hypothetical protein
MQLSQKPTSGQSLLSALIRREQIQGRDGWSFRLRWRRERVLASRDESWLNLTTIEK